jgi:DNA-directed RNA polymerase subunit RPC12/RpoP
MDLRCANCSGMIRIERAESFLVCPFCGSTLVVDRARTFRSFLLPASVSGSHAGALLQEELSRREMPRCKITAVRGFLLPFWGVRGETLQETLPCFSPVPPALAGYKLPSAGAVPFSEGESPGFAPVACSESSSATWEGSPDVSAFAQYRVPFFKVEYGGGEASYTAWVEGVSGRVFLDRTPPSLSGSISRRFWLAMTAFFLLFAAEGLLVPGFGWSLLAVAATAAILFPFARGAFGEGAP